MFNVNANAKPRSQLFSVSHDYTCSADSLEEIVGLDISYHGGIHPAGDTDAESSHQEEERLYYERREQKRQNQRSTLRRRMLLMDLSTSGRKSSNSNNGGDGEDANTGDVGNSQSHRSSVMGTVAEDIENRVDGATTPTTSVDANEIGSSSY